MKKLKSIEVITGFFTHNFILKVATIIMSIFLYIYVGLGNREEKFVEVATRVKENKNGLVQDSEIPNVVNIRLFGSKGALMEIDYSALRASINLENATEGGNQITPIIEGYIPPSVQVVSITPDKINVSMDKENRKYVRVEPELVGDMSILDAWSYTVTPSNILISGPLSILKDIAVLRTQPINIASLRKSDSSDQSVRIENTIKLNPNISPYIKVDRNREYKVVFIRTDEYAKKTILDKVRINILNLGNNLRLKNADSLVVQNISVSVARNMEKKFSLNDMYFFVDLSEILAAGQYQADVSYSSKDGVVIRGFQPKKITVEVEESSVPLSVPEGNVSSENGDKVQEFLESQEKTSSQPAASAPSSGFTELPKRLRVVSPKGAKVVKNLGDKTQLLVAEQGKEYDILSGQPSQYKITFSDKSGTKLEGWVLSSGATYSEENNTLVPKSTLVVRQSPDGNSSAVGQVEAGESYEVMGFEYSAYEIQLPDSPETGWISVVDENGDRLVEILP